MIDLGYAKEDFHTEWYLTGQKNRLCDQLADALSDAETLKIIQELKAVMQELNQLKQKEIKQKKADYEMPESKEDGIISLTSEEQRTVKRKLIAKPFYKDFVKVIDEKQTYVNGRLEHDSHDLIITKKENAEKIKGIENIDIRIFAKGFYHETAYFCMISNEDYDALMRAEKFVYDKDVVMKFKGDLYEANPEGYKLVLYNPLSYQMTDLDENDIILPVRVDYMSSNGHMTDAYYNLEDVLEKLKGQAIFPKDECYRGKEKNLDKPKIISIPYYNRDEGESRQICFYFLPTKEVYEKARQLSDFERTSFMLEEMYGIQTKEKQESMQNPYEEERD